VISIGVVRFVQANPEGLVKSASATVRIICFEMTRVKKLCMEILFKLAERNVHTHEKLEHSCVRRVEISFVRAGFVNIILS
jgi:hypothetical protein